MEVAQIKVANSFLSLMIFSLLIILTFVCLVLKQFQVMSELCVSKGSVWVLRNGDGSNQ